MLTLTPAGEQAVEATLRIGGVRAQIAERLTTEQIEQMTGLLARLVADTPSAVAVAARFPAVRAARTTDAPG
jgi:hypothetical protein